MFEGKKMIVFIDFLFVLCLAFLFISQTEADKGESPIDEKIPTVHVFMEEGSDGKYKTKCNGRIVGPSELVQIMKMAPEKGVNKAQTLALIEENIPYGYIEKFKRAIKRVNVGKNSKMEISWNDQLLSEVK